MLLGFSMDGLWRVAFFICHPKSPKSITWNCPHPQYQYRQIKMQVCSCFMKPLLINTSIVFTSWKTRGRRFDHHHGPHPSPGEPFLPWISQVSWPWCHGSWRKQRLVQNDSDLNNQTFSVHFFVRPVSPRGVVQKKNEKKGRMQLWKLVSCCFFFFGCTLPEFGF